MNKFLVSNNSHIDSDQLQAKLNSLNGSLVNVFSNRQWFFKFSETKKVTLDFNEIETLKNNFPDWHTNLNLDLVFISKILWLDLASSTPESYINKFKGICLFWHALANENAVQLNSGNLESILTHLLLRTWNKGEVLIEPYIISSVKFRNIFCLDNLKHGLSNIGLNKLIISISNNAVRASLTRIIVKLTDGELTYRDWSDGGSYNYLTLDYGQYYVEHCHDFFKKHVALAIAISKTIRAIPLFAQRINRCEDTVRVWTLHFLEGKTAIEIREAMLNQQLEHSEVTIQKLSGIVRKYFFEARRNAQFLNEILKEPNIKHLLIKIGITTSQPNVDRFRFIVWYWLTKADKLEIINLLITSESPINFARFLRELKTLEAAYKLPEIMPNHCDYHAFGLKPHKHRDTSNKYPRQLIRLIESAGLTTLVALTGWRKSEFGFPFSSLVSFPNTDKLDQAAFPCRFRVDWYVFKTSGKTQIQREVTFNIAVQIYQLNELIGANADAPCLFRINADRRNLYNSKEAVARAVIALWTHYVRFYPPFQALDNLEALNNEATPDFAPEEIPTAFAEHPTPNQQDSILNSYLDCKHINENIRGVWKRCRREIPIIEFFFAQPTNAAKEHWLTKYKNGSLDPNWAAVIDENISSDLKSWIKSLSDAECNTNRASRTVTSELVAGCFYPSAHAFRHMWAEAIYRRFDGDAGWMIRSQFKHISKSMWLAYIRDKDNQGAHKAAKQRVVSSLVHNYFLKHGEGYSGQLHTWLRRLSRKTTLLTPEEQEKFVNQIAATEIIDVKANPWGYCLLKRRTASNAKCAQNGQPQRHNASPDLCLGCIHNLMQSNNVDWVLLQLQTHVDSVLNPIVPNIFKKTSYDLIRNAARHIKTLDPHHASLQELEEIINNYQKGLR